MCKSSTCLEREGPKSKIKSIGCPEGTISKLGPRNTTVSGFSNEDKTELEY
jgi:hypothetical protein